MSKAGDIYGKPWSEPEYVVVLHYYVAHRGEPRHHLCNYVVEVAQLLGRTPGAVVMRMENYSSLDPQENQTRKGLVNLSALGSRVFREWVDKPDSLKACAEVLIRDIRTSGQSSLFEPDPVRLPKAFGKYELLDYLGGGGFGSVYSCINSEDQRVYAIKIMRMEESGNVELLGRCRREIKALKALSHPNIISIHEDNLDEQRDFPGFVMDVAEISLTSYLLANTVIGEAGDRPRLRTDEAVHVLDSVFSAVQAMHEHQPALIHRDINPNNILRMPGGRWVLADFSLAKFLLVAASSATFATKTTHGAWGTTHYTAPEQWKDFALADQRADIYSLGVLIWEMLSTAWPPFDRAHLGLPAAIAEVVLRATGRERQHRPESVAALRAALRGESRTGDLPDR